MRLIGGASIVFAFELMLVGIELRPSCPLAPTAVRMRGGKRVVRTSSEDAATCLASSGGSSLD